MPGLPASFRLSALGLTAGLLLTLPSLLPAQAVAPRGLRDPAELEAFLDGVMTAHLKDKHVAGATVSVVKDGKLFFAKGYGYADVAARKPVDAERSLFRIGSISKLFTWTAVMQLVEQGKLDLDKDVNEYLDFKIPATYPQPITLRHIMSHTPGLEEDGRDLFTEDSSHIMPMGKWLPAHMPARVRPPGTYSSYSNWATAVAGYIVQRVSGEPWDQYMEKHILEPLGMSQTTARQPLPKPFEADMSTGYKWEKGRFVPEKWEIITGGAPAGSFSASATDMAKFMLAHLNNGELNGQRILAESTAVLMHSPLFTHDPRLPGFLHGFYEQNSHGLKIFGHGGDTGWFHSDLALIPGEGVGIFVSYNTNTGGELSFYPFLQTVLDHYYPSPPTVVKAPPPSEVNAKRFAGEYVFNRMSYTTYQKAFNLVSAIDVAADSDATLIVKTPFGDMRMVWVDSLLFRTELGDELVAFQADPSGRIVRGFMSMAPMMTLEHLPWYLAPRFHQILLALSLALFVGLVISGVVRFFRRKQQPTTAPLGRGVLFGVALANVIFVVLLVAAVSDAKALMAGESTLLKVALVFPVIGALLTLGGVAAAFMRWRNGMGGAASRVGYTLAVVIAVLYAWSLNTWNLLGWRM